MWDGNVSPFFNSSSPKPSLHHKRKSESVMDVMPPLKMHISEEKMVSQMKGMHLSSTYTPHGSSSSETDSSFLDYVLDNTTKKPDSMASLKICDELKATFTPYFKFNSVPSSILDKFNKGCTALVLWKPPVSSICRSLSLNDENCSNGLSKIDDSEPGSPPPPPVVQHEIVDVDMMVDDDNNNSMQGNDDLPLPADQFL